MHSYVSKLTLLCLLFSIWVINANAQKRGISKIALQKKMQHVKIDQALKTADFFTSQATNMGLSESDEMRPLKSLEGQNGYAYNKYQQFYKNIPIFGASYTLHIKDGLVKRASGYYLPMIDLKTEAQISSERALDIAMQKMNAQKYAWQTTTLNVLSENKVPIPHLVIIDKSFPKNSEQYALAYQIDLTSAEPYDKKRYFVDAKSGHVLLDLPLIMHQSVPGKGVCKYYGEQDITIDSVAPNEFVLRDLSRGNGNHVYNNSGEEYTSSTNYFDLTNENEDEIAVDAHYCTEKFYDYLLNTFNWNGLGNTGESMNCVVHRGDFVNAFWDGNTAFFGDGDCNYGPLTTLEVVAHEFTHGLTDYTSNLIYESESGAINESMSDVFGKALEYYEDPENFKWTIGESFLETPYANAFRSMEDPNSLNLPALYKGAFWTDVGGVHTNSAIGNHWFYFLVEGGKGTNEIDYTYSVDGIGMEKAMQIVFLTQSTALTPSSDYTFYYESSVAAAEELFGENSPEVASVTEAWAVVGLPSEGSGGDELDLAINIEEIFITTCIQDEYYPLEITVSNIGGIPYEPSMNGLISISFNGNNRDFPLVESIPTGETIIYTIDDFIFLDNSENQFVNVSLDLPMDNSFGNNFAFVSINNAYYDANDLSMITFSNDDEISCFGAPKRLQFLIRNESCAVIPMGTDFEIELSSEDGSFNWTESFSFPFDMESKGAYVAFAEVSLPQLIDDLLFYELVFEEDPFSENNQNEAIIPFTTDITTTYLNTFDINNTDNSLLFTGFSYEPNVLYQNENYYGSSSFLENPFGSLCAEPSEVFDASAFQLTSIQMCVDAETIIEPVLEFDLIQFRNQNGIDFPELYDNTTLARVNYFIEDEAIFTDIIVGQEEGLLVPHQFDIPDGFKGKIILDFFHSTGNNFGIGFTDYDVSLLDNLAINGQTTSINSIDNNLLKVFPNPSNGQFKLEYPDKPDFLIVRNLHGQEILRLRPDENAQFLDLSTLPDAYYTVSVLYEDQDIYTKLISKVKE